MTQYTDEYFAKLEAGEAEAPSQTSWSDMSDDDFAKMDGTMQKAQERANKSTAFARDRDGDRIHQSGSDALGDFDMEGFKSSDMSRSKAKTFTGQKVNIESKMGMNMAMNRLNDDQKAELLDIVNNDVLPMHRADDISYISEMYDEMSGGRMDNIKKYLKSQQ